MKYPTASAVLQRSGLTGAPRRSYRLLLVAGLIACCLMTACNHYDFEYGVDFSALPNHGLYFAPYHENLYDFEDEQQSPITNQVSPIRTASSIDGIGMLRGLTEGLTSYQVRQVSGTYPSVSAWGDTIRLSGAVYYPAKGDIKGIVVSCHYTVCADYEVPSMSCFMDAWLATKGYAVVMPDYIGYGCTVDSVHPYMQADLNARNVIDMVLAVRPYFAAKGLKIQTSDIYLMGYSQGAHTAMHVLRLLEDQTNYPEYADAAIRVRRCYVGGGPYYISEFYYRAVGNNYIGIPCSVPMLVLGMNCGRPEGNRFEPEYFFSQRLLANYKNWILSKRYTVDQLRTLIGTSSLDEILSPEASSFGYSETIRLYKELLNHDVPSDFIPEARLYVFHSRDDNVVPFYNAERLYEQLQGTSADVEFDFDHYGVHGMAFAKFLMKVYKKL